MKDTITMRKHIIATLTALTALVLALTGCQGGPSTPAAADCTTPQSLVVAVAVTENSNAQLPQPVLCMAKKAISERKSIAIVREDGAPKLVQSPKVYQVTDAVKDADINKALVSLINAISSLRAETDGDDTMATLDLISRNSPPGASVAIIGTGMADTGSVNLTKQSLATVKPQDVVTKLKALGVSLDLKDRHITWYGFGQDRGTQKPLTVQQRNNYQAIYQAIVTEAGASVDFAPGATSTPTNNPGNGHTVQPVAPATQVVADFPANGERPYGDGSALGFVGNSTAFRDPDAAKEVIGQIVAWLSQHPLGTITVTGTTSSFGDEEGQLKTSRDRAQAVCDAAAAAGADPARLHPVGVGTHFAGFKQDQTNGVLDENIARGNRNVILTFTT